MLGHNVFVVDIGGSFSKKSNIKTKRRGFIREK